MKPAQFNGQEPVALKMDVIVVNLVREGINKHRARELAEHFIKHTTPPQRKPLSDEEIILIVAECASSHQHTDIHLARAIEAAHGIKENMNLQMNLAGIRADFEEKLQRTWVGLTDEDLERIKLLTFEKEINAKGEEQDAVNLDQLIRAAEQLCKEKNK